MIKVGTDMIANWALWNHVTSFLTTSTLESVLEQRQDFSTVQSQPVHAKYIETARTRRSAKLDVLCDSVWDRQSLVHDSTRELAGGADAA